MDQLNFSRKKEVRDPKPMEKATIKSLVTEAKPWEVKDQPQIRE